MNKSQFMLKEPKSNEIKLLTSLIINLIDRQS